MSALLKKKKKKWTLRELRRAARRGGIEYETAPGSGTTVWVFGFLPVGQFQNPPFYPGEKIHHGSERALLEYALSSSYPPICRAVNRMRRERRDAK